MAAKYLVIEIQKFDTGAMSTPSYAFDTLNAAEAKFHTILASAAVSKLPVHSCILLSEEAFPMRYECYKHEEEAEPVEAE